MIEIAIVVAVGLLGGAAVGMRTVDASRIAAIGLLLAGAYLMVR